VEICFRPIYPPPYRNAVNPKGAKKQMPNVVNVRHHLRAFAEKKLQTKRARFLHFKKLALRHRQKIFTTNNHYEWSKSPVAPEMPFR
jgi:hypothetical protein